MLLVNLADLVVLRSLGIPALSSNRAFESRVPQAMSALALTQEPPCVRPLTYPLPAEFLPAPEIKLPNSHRLCLSWVGVQWLVCRIVWPDPTAATSDIGLPSCYELQSSRAALESLVAIGQSLFPGNRWRSLSQPVRMLVVLC